jgi:2-polyprenyl-3-methyl-5-hydroxy-6-metoxy-1,4-benzoquinol methylase
MILNFKNSDNETMSIKIIKPSHDESWSSLMECDDRNYNFEFTHAGETYTGPGIRGDDALWIPYSERVGLKIVANNDRYQSLEESLKTVELIKEKHNVIFPTIYSCKIASETDSGENYLLIVMENMGNPRKNISVPHYIPSEHHNYISQALQVDPNLSAAAVRDITSLKLCPEDEWYKSINFINGKIVDFHRFAVMEERYFMPSNGKSPDELSKIYRNMVDRYKAVPDEHGNPKWKGRIYQGFGFDNGYLMEGYLSGNDMYDSYRKLAFVPLNKSKGKKVLDIGSNQGFFSFQAALHGATEVTGVEYTQQDVQAAEDIREITQLNNVNFINGDAVKYVMDSDEHYGLVVFNSVLHQIYPNFENSDEFLSKLSSMTDYLAFETPLNHPLMRLNPAEVEANLRKHFKIVRLLNVYDAYSSGYRANFVCYS